MLSNNVVTLASESHPFFADTIEYETPQRESVVITEEDLATIEEFTTPS